MISENDQITCLKTYAGEYHFQTEGDRGTYYLTTFPETQQFILTFPDFRTESGSLQELKNSFHLLESYEEGLTRWVYRALKWYNDRDFREHQTWYRKNIVLGEYTYNIEYSPETDEFILTQPGKVTIAYRQELSNEHPEINSLHFGALNMLLVDIIYNATQGGNIKDQTCSPVKLPLSFSPKLYTIQNSEYWIDYKPEPDIFFLHLPVSIKRSHRSLMDIIPELGVIGDGELKQQLEAFMDEHSRVAR